jgi:hypothetical protein
MACGEPVVDAGGGGGRRCGHCSSHALDGLARREGGGGHSGFSFADG